MSFPGQTEIERDPSHAGQGRSSRCLRPVTDPWGVRGGSPGRESSLARAADEAAASNPHRESGWHDVAGPDGLDGGWVAGDPLRVLAFAAHPGALIPIEWVRRYLLPEPDPALVAFRVAVQVSADYWAGVIQGRFPVPYRQPTDRAHGGGDQILEPTPGMSKWRKKFGRKGVSRVTLYTRKNSPFVYMEWWIGGRRQARRVTLEGIPIQDRRLAEEIALRTVERLESEARRDAWLALSSRPQGVSPEVLELLTDGPGNSEGLHAAARSELAVATGSSGTVTEMFDRWMSIQDADMKGKRVSQKCWVHSLGPTTSVIQLTPDDINQAVKKTAEAKSWSPKSTHNRVQHLRMALTYAADDCGWTVPAASRVLLPDLEIPDTEHLTYSQEEYEAILRAALERRELRLAVAVAIGGTHGRRIEQTLHVEAIQVERTHLNGVPAYRIMYARLTEKARAFKDAKYTVAHINQLQHPLEFQAIEALTGTKAVVHSGLLFPSIPIGKSIDNHVPRRRVTQNTMRKYLRKAEARAGIAEIGGRAFHGLKRLAATRCKTEEELRLVSRISNTDYETLLRYHKQRGTFENAATKEAEAQALAKARRPGQGEGRK